MGMGRQMVMPTSWRVDEDLTGIWMVGGENSVSFGMWVVSWRLHLLSCLTEQILHSLRCNVSLHRRLHHHHESLMRVVYRFNNYGMTLSLSTRS